MKRVFNSVGLALGAAAFSALTCQATTNVYWQASGVFADSGDGDVLGVLGERFTYTLNIDDTATTWQDLGGGELFYPVASSSVSITGGHTIALNSATPAIRNRASNNATVPVEALGTTSYMDFTINGTPTLNNYWSDRAVPNIIPTAGDAFSADHLPAAFGHPFAVYNTSASKIYDIRHASSVVSVGSSAGAGMSFGGFVEAMNFNEDADGKVDVSVFGGSAGYQGTATGGALASGTFGDGTVVDYRFINSDGGVVNSYASGSAGRISAISEGTGAIGSSQSFAKVWNATDPAGYSSTPDFDTNTVAGLSMATGSIDISGMANGEIHFLHGAFGPGADNFALIMSGDGVDDVTITAGLASYRPTQMFVTDFDFDNGDLLYDTITYTWDYVDDGPNPKLAEFMGVVVTTPVPEPSTGVIAAMALCGACLRRRR